MRSHKYLRREGTPGNYRYFYTAATGHVVAAEPGSAEHKKFHLEHVKRLLEGRGVHHNMSFDAIASETGYDRAKVRSTSANLQRIVDGKRTGEGQFSDHETKEAHLQPHHPAYGEHIASAPAAGAGGEGAAPAPARSSPRPRRAAGASAPTARTEATPAPDEHLKRLEEEAKTRWGLDLGAERPRAPADHATGEPTPPAPEPSAPVSISTHRTPGNHYHVTYEHADGTRALDVHGPDGARIARHEGLTPETARATSAHYEAAESPLAAHPDQQHARELGRADPDFARSDAPVERMVEAEARGENPYLGRAKEIFDRVKHDVKPERKANTEHMLNAIAKAQAAGRLNEDGVKHFYQEVSGRRNFAGAKEDFGRATFVDLQEILSNHTVDPEIERMQRGYGAKQFARLKPYLKASWSAANPDRGDGTPPPPMPTFGDLKSWTEHGGEKPSWAGTTRMAVPSEVFEATHKTPDGKPKYPPPWLPVHLMPVWTYIAKKTDPAHFDPSSPTAATTANPYKTRNPVVNGRVEAGSQAAYQEGHALNALRRYVQMRGGANQLIDIPPHKLSEAGLTYTDIFKGEPQALTDDQLKTIIKTKLVDPVALLPLVKAELGEGVSATKLAKATIALVVDPDLTYTPPRKATVADLIKAGKIARIKEELRARGVT